MSSSYSLIKLTFLIAILAAVGQMTQTMYVPSIGAMATSFHVSPASLQAVMACFLIPYGLSQFIYGPLSDRVGRRPVIMLGLGIYILGALGCVFSPNFVSFLSFSFIQGLGIGVGGAMCRTVSRDCFSGSQLHKVNSLISMCILFSPLMAPIAGGYLTEWFGWRSSYLFLALFSIAVTIILARHFTETLAIEDRRSDSAIASYRFVLRQRRFQGYLICLMAIFAGVAVFEAAAGVLLGGVLGLPATTVSWLFIIPIPGYFLGAALSSWVAEKKSEKVSLYIGLLATFLGALVIVIPGLLGLTTAFSLIAGATLYFLGAGTLFPAATTGALTPLPRHAGTGGAVLGGMQNLAAGIVTLLASMIPAHSQLPLGGLMLIMSLCAMFGLWHIHRTPDNAQQMPPITV